MDATSRAYRTRPIDRRTLLGGLTASAALAALTACGGSRQAPDAATPTSTPSAPLIPGPPRSTTAPRLTATPLPPAPTSTAAPLVEATAVWTDPRGLIRLFYPRTWLTGVVPPDAPGGGRPGNVLQLSVPYTEIPNGWPALWLDLHDPLRDTLEGAVQRARNEWVGSRYTLTDQVIEDLMVGGEPAKQFRFVYTPDFNPFYHLVGRDVFVNHAGRGFVIEANGIKTDDREAATRQEEIDRIIASIRFLT